VRAAAATLPRPGGALRAAAAALGRGARAASSRGRRVIVIAILLALALAAGYVLWFRDSSFVRVEHVTVTGLTGTDAPRERAGVIAAAKGMTTLHYDEAALRRALGAGATVESIRVTPDFPHGLRIDVVEKSPVAVLEYGSERVAVGSGGVLLPDVRPIPHALPSIAVGALPSGARLGDGRARRLVAGAAAAPAALRARVVRLRELPDKGLVAFLHDGPDVILGSPSDLVAKWTTAAAILADPESRGASYIDVRLPDRPVAGGLDVAPLPAADDPTTAPVHATPPGAAATAPASPGASTSSAPTAQSAAPAAAAPTTPTQGAGTAHGGATTAGTATGTGGAAPGAAP
jgi:cell division protein FtsQ